MYVYDILTEAKDVLAKCSETVIFKRITDAVRLANNSGKFDIALGQMDICVCDGCVTLPADVGTILAVNNAGFPTLIRNQWFQYHANGPGVQCYVPWTYTDELGAVSTFKDPSGPVSLVAEVESSLDSNTELRVYGWDVDGKRIYTEGPEGTLVDGFLVPTVYGFAASNSSAPSIARVDRVEKKVTNGFVRLVAIDPTTGVAQTTIGHYQPWETTPSYRRVRVSNQTWIRIKYRKKDLEVRAATDWINIDNREALLLLLKAVKFRLDNQIDTARSYETEGMRILSLEAEALRPPGIATPQIIFNDGVPAGQYDTLYY